MRRDAVEGGCDGRGRVAAPISRVGRGVERGVVRHAANVLVHAGHRALGRILDGMPRRFEIAEGDVRLSGAIVTYDPAARRAVHCELLTVRK